ncbi:hypothetical protein LH464_23905 [Neorhizobium sp. T786]|nr:hypothetical protein [Neorhizobium xiangyangii]
MIPNLLNYLKRLLSSHISANAQLYSQGTGLDLPAGVKTLGLSGSNPMDTPSLEGTKNPTMGLSRSSTSTETVALGFLAAIFAASPTFAEERNKSHLSAQEVVLAFKEMCLQGTKSPSGKGWATALPDAVPLVAKEIGSDLIRLEKLFSTDGGKTVIKIERDNLKGGDVTYCTLKTSLESGVVSERIAANLTTLAKDSSLGEPVSRIGRRFKNTATSWESGNWRLDLYEGRKVRPGIVAIGMHTFPSEAPAEPVFVAVIAVNHG